MGIYEAHIIKNMDEKRLSEVVTMDGIKACMLLAVLAAAFILFAGCAQQNGTPPYTPPGGTPPYPAGGGGVPGSMAGAGTGRMVFTATDKAADMGAVSSVKVTIDAAEVHSTANGWVSLNITPTTVDLLQLRATSYSALLADVHIPPGDYDQVWLDISNVVVTDANGTHDAKLPSGTLKFNLNSRVTANQTSTVLFDFDASHSLHVTGNGRYILAPVVRVDSKDETEVDDSDRANVRVMGGRVREHKDVGMDVNGNMDVNLSIPENANVSIDDDNVIRIHVGGEEGSAQGGANAGGSANGQENGQGARGEYNESQNSSINSSADIGARIRIGAG